MANGLLFSRDVTFAAALSEPGIYDASAVASAVAAGTGSGRVVPVVDDVGLVEGDVWICGGPLFSFIPVEGPAVMSANWGLIVA